MLRNALKLGAAGVLSLSLASCVSIPGFSDNLPQQCKNAVDLHASFVIVAGTGTVKPSLIAKEQAAWEAVQLICNDPDRYKDQAAVITLAEMYATMISVLRSVR